MLGVTKCVKMALLKVWAFPAVGVGKFWEMCRWWWAQPGPRASFFFGGSIWVLAEWKSRLRECHHTFKIWGLNSSQSGRKKCLNYSLASQERYMATQWWKQNEVEKHHLPMLYFLWGLAWWENPSPWYGTQVAGWCGATCWAVSSNFLGAIHIAKQYRVWQNVHFRQFQQQWITCGYLINLRYFLLWWCFLERPEKTQLQQKKRKKKKNKGEK